MDLERKNSTNYISSKSGDFAQQGISLYKATDTNLSNWKQLELDENDNETVNETPCN